MRAVQASDYAIGEFKILRRLLMFHGRTNNKRISNMILYFFFKNFVFTIPQFYYAFINNSSGQTVYDDWFISLYNMIFTALPLMVVALLDHDLKPDDGDVVDKLMPFLYLENRNNPIFTKSTFVAELLKGCGYGIINFLFTIYSVGNTSIDSDGNIGGLWFMSVNLFTSLLFIVSIRLFITQKFITWLNVIFMLVTSWVTYFIFVAFVHKNNYFKSASTMTVAFNSGRFYLNLILIVGTTAFLDYVYTAYITLFKNYLENKLRIQMSNSSNGKLLKENLEEMDSDIIDKYNKICDGNEREKPEQQIMMIENGMNEVHKKEFDLSNVQKIEVIKKFKNSQSMKNNLNLNNDYNNNNNNNNYPYQKQKSYNLSEDNSINKRYIYLYLLKI
jgi:phospholipid-translocating ATPase